jgi:salicylate hydroxylase
MVWPYKVRVVGAGIAGLSFAVALAQKAKARGLGELSTDCLQVDEAASSPSSDGAGIQLGPNVVRLLQNELGLSNALRTLSFAPKCISLYSLQSGKRLARLSLEDFEHRYGAKYLTMHRASLQSSLLARLHESGHAVNWASPFNDDQNGPLPTVSERKSNQTRITQGLKDKDRLLVGADGRKSTCRKVYFESFEQAAGRPEETNALRQPFFTGQLALRSVVTSLNNVPEAQQHEIAVWTAPHHHLVGYPMVMPVAEGTLLHYNLVGFITSEDTNANAAGWSHLASTDQVGLLLQALHPSLQWIPTSAESWSSWPLWASPTMQSPEDHYKNNVFLIGDAAHAMRPHQAQGSAMAIEDACALAHHLTSGLGTLHDKCQRTAQERWQRNARVQRQSLRNGRIFQLTGPLAWFRDRALGLAGSRLMDQPWLFRGSSSL